MAKMSPSSLSAMLQSQHADALSAQAASKLSTARSDAMDYYLGDMTKDMPAPEGRSQAVSSDVADTVEGIMPALLEVFHGGDETITFNPVGPDDVKAAEQETDYVNYIYNQANNGFLTTYSFIKDALLSKTGIVKVFWETKTIEERESYFDLSEDEYALLLADDDVEVVEHTEHGPDEDGEDEGGRGEAE